MEKGLGLEVLYLDELDSTHVYLYEKIKKGEIKPPFAVCARTQKSGIGSRGNEWASLDGNLFLSFCVDKNFLPSDLNAASISIYFSVIMSEFLAKFGSKIWVKWPNDFYINKRKIGGILSAKIGEIYIGSVGLNLASAPQNAGILDIKISREALIAGYIKELEKKISWKQIFSKFKIEFAKSKSFITHIGTQRVNLADASLCDDGAILLDDKKVYSLR